MRILKLPAKILYDVSDVFNQIFKNVFLCVSIQIAARISTGKSDMAIAHCWIWQVEAGLFLIHAQLVLHSRHAAQERLLQLSPHLGKIIRILTTYIQPK